MVQQGKDAEASNIHPGVDSWQTLHFTAVPEVCKHWQYAPQQMLLATQATWQCKSRSQLLLCKPHAICFV
jgi:hypothetical protein